MDERRFNSLMPIINERWAATVLSMIVNPNRGPDLIDSEKAVEIKFKMLYPDGKYAHKCWRVQEHQLSYEQKFSEIYWGLGFYKIDRLDVEKINANELEKITNYRELYLVKWDWMHQFESYHHTGKTSQSEWDYFMRFPKFSKIPRIISEQEVSGGKILFTEGVNPERFILNKNQIQPNTYKDVPF